MGDPLKRRMLKVFNDFRPDKEPVIRVIQIDRLLQGVAVSVKQAVIEPQRTLYPQPAEIVFRDKGLHRPADPDMTAYQI
ncbi:hypothetical protein Xinn_04151 [Xenorhabdus innexi]|uniref:Uncharacterized protein n=1 Tax=Xenorhabdus innexi TaxID=290109 RepID=A0A2G0MIX5_9GAMM|nr:hypothetical protein Xinn_04151 [Xenorhabdus innexi]